MYEMREKHNMFNSPSAMTGDRKCQDWVTCHSRPNFVFPLFSNLQKKR